MIQPSVTTAFEKTAAPCVLKHLQSGPINETSQGLRRSSWSLRGVNLRIGDAADRPRVSPSHSNGVVA